MGRFKGDRETKYYFMRFIFVLLGILIIISSVSVIAFIFAFDEHEYTDDGKENLVNVNYRTIKTGTDKIRKEIQELTSRVNKEEKIKNQNKFGESSGYALIIVIQVHRRLQYLNFLIQSFNHADHIEEVLLIFSHAVYDVTAYKLINSIRFCRVMQIFYPHAIQLYPNIFPGLDPLDCPPNITKSQGVKRNCNNALYVDTFGKYRHPYLAEIKHHWWWKANRIFNLAALKNYTDLVLFLEEDNYVLKDFIHVLNLMKGMMKHSSKQYKTLSLSGHLNSVKYSQLKDSYLRNTKVEITNKMGNLGVAINRATWRKIAQCKYSFCYYDDFNFDMSLRNVFRTCVNSSVHLVMQSARAFRLGSCGSHYNGDCQAEADLEGLAKFLERANQYLFPGALKLSSKFYILSSKLHGRWGDPRDRALCLGMTIK